MSGPIALDIFCPAAGVMLSANDHTRMHRMKYAKYVRVWRAETMKVFGERIGRLTLSGEGASFIGWRDPASGKWALAERVRIDAEIRFWDRAHRDAANYHATVKPIVDELVSCGLIVDDTPQWLDGPHVTIGEPLPAGRAGARGLVTLTITELEK